MSLNIIKSPQGLFAVFVFLTGVLGTVGNIFLLVVILNNKKIRKQPSMVIISSLSAWDALGGSVVGSSVLIFTLKPNLTLDSNYCTTLGLLSEIAFIAHTIHMLILATNRFVLIYFPFILNPKITSLNVTFIQLILTFIISITIRIWHWHRGGIIFFPFLSVCLVNYDQFKLPIFKVHIISQYTILGVVTVLYALILIVLKKRRKSKKNWNSVPAVESASNKHYLKTNPKSGIVKESLQSDKVSQPKAASNMLTTVSALVSAKVSKTADAKAISSAAKRKETEKDIAWYAIFVFIVYLIDTLSFTITQKLSISNVIIAQILSDTCALFFCLIFSANSWLSFIYIKLLKEEALKFICKQ